MERFYRFAGITFRIAGQDADMYREDGALAAFRVDGPAFDHSLELEIVTHLPPPEGECIFSDARKRVYRSGDAQLRYVGEVARSVEGAYMRILGQERYSRVQILRDAVPDRIMPRLVLNAMEAEHHIVQRGGFVLHASFIRWEDRAILFTAPSGTGKSTQAGLWSRLRGAEQINGDRTAVTLEPSGVTAWGIPYCGTSGVCRNQALPVAAIVYLSQAPQSNVFRLSGLRAFRSVWEGCSVNTWDREDVSRCTRTVMEAVQRVPVYHLACTPDETAVMALEKALQEGR